MTEADTRQHADFARQAWHAMQPEELEHALDTDLDAGLSEGEIEKRRERFGTNRLTPQQDLAGRIVIIGYFPAAVPVAADDYFDIIVQSEMTPIFEKFRFCLRPFSYDRIL